jgi:hypothetical protein
MLVPAKKNNGKNDWNPRLVGHSQRSDYDLQISFEKKRKAGLQAHKPSTTDLEISMVNTSTVTIVNCLNQLLEVLS